MLLVLLLAAAAGCATSRDTVTAVDAEAAAEVPTKTVLGPGGDGLTLVRPRIENREDLGWFLLDSGSAGLMISRSDARRLGLPRVGEGLANRGVPVELVRADSFILGPLVIRYPVLASLEWERAGAFREVLGEDFGGIVGFPVFDRAMVEVRYGDPGEADRVFIHPRRDVDPAEIGEGGRWQPLQVVDRRPIVTARLFREGAGEEAEGVEARLVVDTGTSTALSLDHDFAREAGLLEGLEVRHGRQITLHGVVDVLQGRLHRVELAGRRIDDVPLTLRPAEARRFGALPGRVDGFIGRGLLIGSTVLFDYPGRRITIVESRPRARP